VSSIIVNTWATPATAYKRTRHGKAEIVSVPYKAGAYHAYGSRPTTGSSYDLYTTKGILTTELQIDGKTWMTDEPAHFWTIKRHARAYRGRVAVAGLGLGLVCYALANNQLVDISMWSSVSATSSTWSRP